MEKKNHFIEVMVDFLEDTIDFDQYINCFYEIDYEIQEYKEKLKSDFEKLRAFEPDPRSKGFAILIENLFSDIRVLEPDDELRTEDEISEKSLRDGIKEFLPKIQNFLNKDSTDFSELVDQLNWEIKDQYFELIEEFLDESSNFLNLNKKYESVVKVAKELESNSIFLDPSYQALGFSNFIHILIQLFDRYQMDPEISPKVFKSWVRKILLEMKNHYS